MSSQVSQTVIVQQKQGCFGGCLTFFAMLVVIGLGIRYWYIAVPVLIVGAAFAYYQWDQNRKRAGRVPTPKTGIVDPWIDQVRDKVATLGFTEQTRNTGALLGGVPLLGDGAFVSGSTQVWANLFSTSQQAEAAAITLRDQQNFREGMANGHAQIQVQGRVLYTAFGQGQPLASDSLHSFIAAAQSAPPASTELPQTALHAAEGSTSTVEPASVSGSSTPITQQLRELGELRERGVVTEAEFQAKKAELLKRM
jgi:hypothetical protein